MRRQDELLAIYPSADAWTRKYILGQTESLARAFDSDELLALLQRERGAADASVAHQATFSLCRFLPDLVARRHGLAVELRGAWSQRAADSPALTSDPARVAARETALAAALAPVVRVLDRAPAGDPDAAFRITMALAHLPGSEAERAAQARLHGACTLAALAAAAPAAARMTPHPLEVALARRGAGVDLLLGLPDLPPARASALACELASRVTLPGRMNLAQLAGRLEAGEAAELCERLLAGKEGWVAVHLLAAVESHPTPEKLALVSEVRSAVPRELVHIHALRAAARIGGAGALELAEAGWRTGTPPVQAQALESLVRLSAPRELLARVAQDLTSSPSLRARVNARLTLGPDRAGEVPAEVAAMLAAVDPLHRLEGAYALGFLQGPRALEALDRLARLDPVQLVAVQAVKALSRYPARDAAPYLAALADVPRLTQTAARVMGRYESDQAATIAAVVMERLPSAATPAVRAMLCRTLGAAAGRSFCPAAAEVLARAAADPDPLLAAGAIEGWLLLAARHEEAAPPRVARPEVRLAVRSRLARFASGELGAFEGVESCAGTAEGLSALAETALELALLTRAIASGAAFPALARALDGREAGVPPPGGSVPVVDDPPPADDPEFPVHRPARARAGRPLPSPAPAEAPPALAPDLQRPELAAQARRFEPSRRVREITTVRTGDLESPGLLDALRSSAWLRMAAAAVSITALVLCVALARAHATARRGRPPLTLAEVFGDLRPAASEGSSVPAGARLATGRASRAVLLTAAGGRLQLGPTTELAVHSIDAEGARLSLALTPGWLEVNGESLSALHLECGRYTLKAAHSSFRIERFPDHTALVVVHGSITATDGARSRDLPRGSLLDLD